MHVILDTFKMNSSSAINVSIAFNQSSSNFLIKCKVDVNGHWRPQAVGRQGINIYTTVMPAQRAEALQEEGEVKPMTQLR